ncbi:hypothetical protein FQZ97_1203220 [compost metagenome]
MAVRDGDVERGAQRGLVADEQAHHAEVRELTRLGHAQPEVQAVAGLRRALQHGHGGLGGNAQLGVVDQRVRQAHAAQQRVRIEPTLPCHLGEVGEYGGAHQGRHRRGIRLR